MGVVGAPEFSGDSLDVSPDGQQLAVSKRVRGGEAQNDIWLIDLATGRATPLTDDHAGDYDPTWSPDGNYIVFNSGRLGGQSLFLRASDGSGADVPLAKFEKSESNRFTVASWSRADVLIFNVLNKSGDMDLWTLSVSGDRTRRVFVSSKQNELNGAFSPDGRWVAYQSNASGRHEIVVRPFPDRDPARTISRDGGRYPRWRGDGKELFFVSPAGTMMAAGFDPTNGVSPSVPQPLFATPDQGRRQPTVRSRQVRSAFSSESRSGAADGRRHGLAYIARPVNDTEHGCRTTRPESRTSASL